MSKRKNVTLRVSEHHQSDVINQWLDEQKNIQESLTNIVLHMIERFGVRNITDYDIQKILYQESSTSSQPESPSLSVHEKTIEHEGIVVKGPKGLVVKEKKQPEQEDDMYGELDINNL